MTSDACADVLSFEELELPREIRRGGAPVREDDLGELARRFGAGPIALQLEPPR